MDVNKHRYIISVKHIAYTTHTHAHTVSHCVSPCSRSQWRFYCNMQQWTSNLCLTLLLLLLLLCTYIMCVCVNDNWRLCCTWFIYFMNLILITLVGDFIFYSSIEALLLCVDDGVRSYLFPWHSRCTIAWWLKQPQSWYFYAQLNKVIVYIIQYYRWCMHTILIKIRSTMHLVALLTFTTLISCTQFL